MQPEYSRISLSNDQPQIEAEAVATILERPLETGHERAHWLLMMHDKVPELQMALLQMSLVYEEEHLQIACRQGGITGFRIMVVSLPSNYVKASPSAIAATSTSMVEAGSARAYFEQNYDNQPALNQLVSNHLERKQGYSPDEQAAFLTGFMLTYKSIEKEAIGSDLNRYYLSD